MTHMLLLGLSFRRTPGLSGSFFVIYMNPLSQIPTQYPNRVNTPTESGTCCTPCMYTSTCRSVEVLHLFSWETICLVTGVSTVCYRLKRGSRYSMLLWKSNHWVLKHKG